MRVEGRRVGRASGGQESRACDWFRFFCWLIFVGFFHWLIFVGFFPLLCRWVRGGGWEPQYEVFLVHGGSV